MPDFTVLRPRSRLEVIMSEAKALRHIELNAMLDIAIAFADATKSLVADMRAKAYSPDDKRPVGPAKRPIDAAWRASSAVVHFTLHQAFETYLKFILGLEESHVPSTHPLSDLYERLSYESKVKVNTLYEQIVKPAYTGDRVMLAAKFSHTPIPDHDRPPDIRGLDTAKQWFVVMDEQMRLWERRYEAEDVRRARWTIYYLDFEPMFVILHEIGVYAIGLFHHWARE